jgi:hypothetical protein
MAEEPETPQKTEQPQDRPEGEDHREDPPGYDLDEQAAIERLRRERDERGG